MTNPGGYVAVLKAKVSLLGGSGVGKTSLIRRYVLDEFDDKYVMTLGAKIMKRAEPVELPGVGRVLVDLTLWDTMGEEFLRPTLSDLVLHGVKGILAVCDVSDRGSVAPMTSWIDLSARYGEDIPVQILANKSDLGGGTETVRDALALGRRHFAPCYLTSAKRGDNVADAFRDLALRIAARAHEESEAQMDAVSLGVIVEASAKPRTVAELARAIGLPFPVALSRAESLVRRGYLRVIGFEVGADGRPLVTFAATGKSFPPLETGPAARPR